MFLFFALCFHSCLFLWHTNAKHKRWCDANMNNMVVVVVVVTVIAVTWVMMVLAQRKTTYRHWPICGRREHCPIAICYWRIFCKHIRDNLRERFLTVMRVNECFSCFVAIVYLHMHTISVGEMNHQTPNIISCCCCCCSYHKNAIINSKIISNEFIM